MAPKGTKYKRTKIESLNVANREKNDSNKSEMKAMRKQRKRHSHTVRIGSYRILKRDNLDKPSFQFVRSASV